jgi:hypothetical protein
MGVVASELHAEFVSVKVKVACPEPIPVTIPLLVTDATEGLLLTHIPPTEGLKVVFDPMQILLGPVKLILGLANTLIGTELSDIHPVALLVNRKVAVPELRAVTIPSKDTLAMAGLLLDQVPMPCDDNAALAPIHNPVPPLIVMIGLGFIVIVAEGKDEQANIFSTKVNVAVPGFKADTIPLFVMLAIEGLLLIQIPPVVGENEVVVPTQITDGPFIVVKGLSKTVSTIELSDLHPVRFSVKRNFALPAVNAVTIPLFVIFAIPGAELTHTPPLFG